MRPELTCSLFLSFDEATECFRPSKDKTESYRRLCFSRFQMDPKFGWIQMVFWHALENILGEVQEIDLDGLAGMAWEWSQESSGRLTLMIALV